MKVNPAFAIHLIISIMGGLATGLFTYLVLNWFYERRGNGNN